MFCNQCGKEILGEPRFCSHCGAQLSSIEDTRTKKQKIANNLKPYKELKSCLCLECGYSGPMGVVRKIPFSKKEKRFLLGVKLFSFLLIIIISPRGLLMGLLIGLLLGAVISFIESKLERKVLFCPACQQEIEERR